MLVFYTVGAVALGLLFGSCQVHEQLEINKRGCQVDDPDLVHAWMVVVLAALLWPIVVPRSIVELASRYRTTIYANRQRPGQR